MLREWHEEQRDLVRRRRMVSSVRNQLGETLEVMVRMLRDIENI